MIELAEAKKKLEAILAEEQEKFDEQDMILINPKRCCKLRGFTDQLETEKLVVEPHGLIKFVRVKNRFQYTVWSHRGRIVGKSTLAGLG